MCKFTERKLKSELTLHRIHQNTTELGVVVYACTLALRAPKFQVSLDYVTRF